MRINFFLVITLVIGMGYESICYSEESIKITGLVYGKEKIKTIPGALIALYDANDNILLDYTYSTNKGDFSLNTVIPNGQFYITAITDQCAGRTNFSYWQKKNLKPFTIYCKNSRSGIDKILYYLNKLDSIIIYFLGIISTPFLLLINNRRKIYTYKRINRDITNNIIIEHDNVEKIIDKENNEEHPNHKENKKEYENAIQETKYYIKWLNKQLEPDEYSRTPFLFSKDKNRKQIKNIINTINDFLTNYSKDYFVDILKLQRAKINNKEEYEEIMKGFIELKKQKKKNKLINKSLI